VRITQGRLGAPLSFQDAILRESCLRPAGHECEAGGSGTQARDRGRDVSRETYAERGLRVSRGTPLRI
jgi:hypothetical protein